MSKKLRSLPVEYAQGSGDVPRSPVLRLSPSQLLSPSHLLSRAAGIEREDSDFVWRSHEGVTAAANESIHGDSQNSSFVGFSQEDDESLSDWLSGTSSQMWWGSDKSSKQSPSPGMSDTLYHQYIREHMKTDHGHMQSLKTPLPPSLQELMVASENPQAAAAASDPSPSQPSPSYPPLHPWGREEAWRDAPQDLSLRPASSTSHGPDMEHPTHLAKQRHSQDRQLQSVLQSEGDKEDDEFNLPTPIFTVDRDTMPELTPLPDSTEDRQKIGGGKMAHNEKERVRRARIKDACEHMRRLVPGVGVTADKATVLELAVRYIRYLRQIVGQSHDEEFCKKIARSTLSEKL